MIETWVSGATGGDVVFSAPRSLAITAQELEFVADENKGGIHILAECSEADDTARMAGPLCLPTDG